jgi:hypothetical protein
MWDSFIFNLKKENKMDGLTEGRIVHYVMPNGQHRPAIVVKVWNSNGMANLQVFTDGPNDLPFTLEEKEQFSNFGMVLADVHHGHVWKTSILFSEEPKLGTWHWIEKA